MTSGQFLRCHQLDEKPATCNQDVDNLFNQLTVKGVSWLEWNESMPQPCYLLNAGSSRTGSSYRPKHNPAVYYADIEGGDFSGATGSAFCGDHVITMGGTGFDDTSSFDIAVANGDVPRFNYIVPNECEDGHDNCKPQGNGVAQFDAFLAREVPIIENSPGFQQNGLLIITFDEGTSNRGPGSSKQFSGGGNVVFAALGPLVQPGIYGNTYNHYSFLRTLEDGFGISEHPAGASTADPINTIWK